MMSEETQSYETMLQAWLKSVGASSDGAKFHLDAPCSILLTLGKGTTTIDGVTSIEFLTGGALDLASDKGRTFTMLHRVVAVQVGETAESRAGFV